MELHVKGKNLEVSDAIRSYAERKLSKLDKQVSKLARVEVELAVEKKLDAVEASMAKMLAGELQCKVADECLQFYGGWGYMMEYQIAHSYIDARIRRIAGGSSEVMREIISRKIFGR